MKTHLLLIAFIFSLTAMGQYPIANGGFENWNSRSFDFPEYYPFNSNSDYMSAAVFNLTKTTDASHGSFAARMITLEEKERGLNFGYFLNSNVGNKNPQDWTGGIPISETPTGLQGYFKYNVAQGDTALAIVAFSKGGVNIGTYFFPLYGVHTSYTLFDFNFLPALTVTPDSMVVGFVSSLATKEIGLPGSELFVDNISLKGVTEQPDRMNGDFEYWNTNTIESPQNWYSQNVRIEAFTKTSEAIEGSFAIQLTTEIGDQNGHQVARPNQISTGYWIDNSGTSAGGTRFCNSKDTLAFYYKYVPTKPDGMAEVTLQFKKNGNNFWFSNYNLSASADYKYMELPFEIGNGMMTPDTVIISFTSSRWSDSLTSYAGSVLTLDNLHFKAVPPPPPPANPQIPNGSFELWDSQTFDNPEFYPFTSNSPKTQNRDARNLVFKTSDAYHGNYAIKMITSAFNSQEMNFGFVMNAEPNGPSPSSWKGGIPITEKPTGIRGYYKYNVATGDTAMVIATFSKAGVNIGSYYILLSGVHENYTLFDYDFNPALPVTPDSMILAFASSYSSNRMGLPGTEFYVDSVSLKGVVNQPTQLNGDFENWSLTSYDTPVNWYMESESTDLKTTDAAVGDYAIKLKTYLNTNEMGNSQARATKLSNCFWNQNTRRWEGGMPLINPRDTVAFYYKYSPAQPNDSAVVTLTFRKDGNEFWYLSKYLTASSNYKYVEWPMDYFYWITPDSIMIRVESSLWSDSLVSHVGSVLILDNIHFKSPLISVSVPSVKKAESSIGIYPNPTYGRFKIDAQNTNIEKIDLFSLTGQRIISMGKGQIQPGMEIDLGNYPSGIYLVRMYDGVKTHTFKVIRK